MVDVDKIMRKVLLVGCLVLFSNMAMANSYMDMITTPPEGYQSLQATSHNINTKQKEVVAEPGYFVYNEKVSAPVVMPSNVKYQAWLRSQNQPRSYFHTDLQDAINFVSGSVFLIMAYDLFGPRHRNILLK